MRFHGELVAALVAACSVACLLASPSSKPGSLGPGGKQFRDTRFEPVEMDAQTASDAVNTFSLNMLSELIKAEDAGANVVVSPVSVSSALAMVAVGSTEGGACAAEFDELMPPLSLSQDDGALLHAFVRQVMAADPAVQLLVANSQWTRGLIREEYKKQVHAQFQAETQALTNNPAPINRWVSAATRGLIPSIVDEVDPLTEAMLVNAVYFKGSWQTQFDPKLTSPYGIFTKADGTEVPCEMMSSGAARRMPYAQLEEGGVRFQLVELPYGSGERFAAALLVPEAEAEAGALDALAAAAPTKWAEWTAALSPVKAVVNLPRFKAEYGVRDLKVALAALGLQEAFTGHPEGAFLRMSPDRELYLHAVLHKTVLEVNEEGTEAAAATAAVMMTRAMPMNQPPRVTADRPFLFAVRDTQTGLLLFVGKLEAPEFTFEQKGS